MLRPCTMNQIREIRLFILRSRPITLSSNTYILVIEIKSTYAAFMIMRFLRVPRSSPHLLFDLNLIVSTTCRFDSGSPNPLLLVVMRCSKVGVPLSMCKVASGFHKIWCLLARKIRLLKMSLTIVLGAVVFFRMSYIKTAMANYHTVVLQITTITMLLVNQQYSALIELS
jgi:hypothetical protein